MRILPVVAVCALGATSLADKKSDAVVESLTQVLTLGTKKVPLVLVEADTALDVEGRSFSMGYYTGQVAVVFAADGSARIAAGLSEAIVCGTEGCDKIIGEAQRKTKVAPQLHASAVFDGEQPLFIHYGSTGHGVGHGEPMAAKIDDAAKPAVELFEKTIGDPKAFAATVSTRKDVAMLGTEASERFIGGDTVRAALIKWNLALTKVGGIRAGTTKSKTVAWVIADVDARTKNAKAAPYRISVVYEKTGTEWKIVQLQFS